MKRTISVFLTVILFVGTFMAVLFTDALGGRQAIAEENAFLLNGNVLSNQYVEFQINPNNGRFTIGTVEGNPAVTTDNNQVMLFGHHDSPRTSYTTIHVDGTSNIYGDAGFTSAPAFVGNRNESTAQYGDIRVQQIISIVENSSTGRADNVEIRYAVTNTGTVAHAVGVRIMLDTMLGNNDKAPFRIPGTGDLTTEKEFAGDSIPQYWQAFDSLTSPKVVSSGNFVSVPIRPDKVQFTNWHRVYELPWGYEVSEGTTNGDSAVSIIWERTLAAGAREEYVTRYGLSELVQDMEAPLTLTIASGGSVLTNAANDAYLPYTITAYVQNIGNETIDNVVSTIRLPGELAFVDDQETGIINLGSLAPGEIRTIEKTVYVRQPVAVDTVTQFSVSVSGNGVPEKTLTKNLLIPALNQEQEEEVFRIIIQPKDQYVTVGQRGTFTVRAEGNGLTYQWYINRNDGNGWVVLDGATAASYTTSAADMTCDGFQYCCAVTNSSGSSILSSAAVLHVSAAPVVPNTGDSAMPAVWGLMMLVSAAGLIMMFWKKRFQDSAKRN